MNSSPKLINIIGGSTTSKKREFATNRHLQYSKKETKNLRNNKFKVATTPNTATLEYYQSIYTHCKQRFNIPDGIEVVKKSVYQYIENCINNYLFGNYNISEVKSNLYNNLVHYSQLGTENLNSETLATYFQELNFNIIEYCEKKYPVQSKYSFDFESETETSNKGKQRLKQYSRTTPNTPTLQKTTAKHLQTPEQGTSVKLPLSITLFLISLVQPQTPSSPLNCFSRPEDFHANIIDYLQENESNHSKSLKSEKTESEPEEITENKKKMATAYIAKIPEYTGKNNDTSLQEWLDKVQKAGNANAFKDAFLQQFTDNNTSITLRNCFCNIKQETSETVMTYLGRFNKLLRQIRQLETNNYYSDAQILDQFIAELKDKLIKKVRPHAPADLATAIRHAKSYEMAMEEANHTKLTNSQKRLKATLQTNNHKDINPHNDATKTILDHHPTTNLKIVIIVEFQDTGNKIVGNYKETNKTGVINITFHHNNPITNLYYHYYSPAPQPMQQQYQQFYPIQPYQTPPTQQYQVPARRLVQHKQFTSQNQLQSNHNRINSNNQLVSRNSGQQRPNHYHTQSSYLTIPEKSDFQQTALSEGEVAVLRSNPSNHIIPPVQIAQNTNLSDIFPFEFEANKSPFLLSNAAVNKQKAITAMYTEATVKGKLIHLILDSGSAGSIITYQLMQQLKQNVDRPAQTVIVTADNIKKTPVEEIDDFLFSIDKITIPSEIIGFSRPSKPTIYHKKAPVFEFEEKKEMPLTKTYMALGSTSNWAEETKQEIFEESRGWKKVRYSTPEPWKQPPYIPLKYKDCNKKLSSMGACISPEEKYETCTYYFCKACHRERFESPKKSRKWDNTPCLTCGKMLSEECNWIDVAMRRRVCDQTCQYALSISEKVRRRIPFDAAYNSALNKLYHYPHNAEIIFDLAMALINEATQEDVHQMKEVEYIEHIMELAGFDYEDEVETYHQIASHTYPTKEAQIQ
ncbi:hypothetical protein G9A89_022494 [Geosiphon pyriformis]|nr:hypothetical protein G9A89_022494 [Geosiphon pyriformis]